MREIFVTLTSLYNLGEITQSPERVFGGLLHEMWKVTTSSGVFAIKILNPEIMSRPEAYGNFVFSEKIANQAKDAGIPALPAVKIGDDSLVKIGDQYVMVFPWKDGVTLSTEPAQPEKARAIGGILAKIHNLGSEDSSVATYGEMTVNQDYLAILERQFHGITQKILELQERHNRSLPILNSESVLSHGDIDQKNVLWDQYNNPTVIDWEAAGYVNPMVELFTAALYWGGIVSGGVNKEAFRAVLEGYDEIRPIDRAHVPSCLDGCVGCIHWLMYNVQRSETDLATTKQEKELAAREVTKTVALVELFYSQIETYKSWALEDTRAE